MPFVQTVRGQVDAGRLGAVDAHEHVFLSSPFLAGEHFDDPDRMRAELDLVARGGIDTVVDLTTVGLGRRPAALAEISERSGVHVVLATGYHRDAHYAADHWVHREDAGVLLDVVLTDLRTGIDDRDWRGPAPRPTAVRAGVVKVGASYQRMTAGERLRIEVGIEAARLTGVGLAAHCEIGTLAAEILDLAEAGGLTADRVALAHMDRNPDPELHGELAGRGAYLLYDTVGRVKYRPDSDLVALIERVLDGGHADRLLLGTDVGRRTMLRSYGGGPGMDVLGRDFLPRLRRRVGDEPVDRITRTNPARFLATKDAS
ncbi:phosphotriesterase family protein [Phytohabitans sp. LJ34]|uniref:phosphotriesterase family protein n=1 Tax=Phytohabitans sp. LJ34 TaxID=3452217 RepID=UPI003F8A3C12